MSGFVLSEHGHFRFGNNHLFKQLKAHPFEGAFYTHLKGADFVFTDLNKTEIFHLVEFIIMAPVFIWWAVSKIRNEIKTRRRIRELEEINEK